LTEELEVVVHEKNNRDNLMGHCTLSVHPFSSEYRQNTGV